MSLCKDCPHLRFIGCEGALEHMRPVGAFGRDLAGNLITNRACLFRGNTQFMLRPVRERLERQCGPVPSSNGTA